VVTAGMAGRGTVSRRTAVQLLAFGLMAAATAWTCATAPLASEPAATVPATTVPPPATTTTVLPQRSMPPDTVQSTVSTLPAELLEQQADSLCPTWLPILLYVGFPDAELATADRILWAESRCRLDAVNYSDPNGGSWCAFQLNRVHEARLVADGVLPSWETLITDPVLCAAAAHNIWDRNGGWQAWATY
jgi:hypothetical protein